MRAYSYCILLSRCTHVVLLQIQPRRLLTWEHVCSCMYVYITVYVYITSGVTFQRPVTSVVQVLPEVQEENGVKPSRARLPSTGTNRCLPCLFFFS